MDWLLWVGRMWVVAVCCCGSVAVLVAVGRLLCVGWVAVGLSLSVAVDQSLCAGCFLLVALGRPLCGTVVVGRALWDGRCWSLWVGHCGSVALSVAVGCCR